MLSEIVQGDCLEVMKGFPDNHFSAIVCDPPYAISFMQKIWDETLPSIQIWAECLRVLKPGGHLLAFGGTRTFHRLTCNIEDAAFEIRDCISWLYASGFPKSHNHFGIEGYGTALKPAWEPIIVAMRPCDGTFAQNAEKWGQAGINIDGCRIPTSEIYVRDRRNDERKDNITSCYSNGIKSALSESHIRGRWPANVIFDDFNEQILCLKSSIPGDIIITIEEYYHDYKLPNLSEENKNIPKSCKKEQSPVLQPLVLQPGIDRVDERESSSDERKETSDRIDRKNAQASYEEGKEQPEVSRVLVQSGIPSCESSKSESISAINCETDDQKTRNCGTSDYHGDLPESASKEIRGCASSQRGQRRQSHREFRDDGQFDPQDGTQGNFEGTSVIEVRKRALKVLACDVPEKWLKYFEETGDEIRSPHRAAKMLDEQSGISKSKPFKQSQKTTGFHDSLGRGQRKTRTDDGGHSDFGGASRFFYCAKTSSRERNEGLEGLPDKLTHRYGEKAQGPLAQQTPSKGVIEKNNHPTVKPLKLMEYLIKLVMPPQNGLLLDPFAGSGSTILAAKRLGFDAIGIEKQPEYCEIARARLNYEPEEPQLDMFQ